MPKQTFFNLPTEKKERLLQAAYQEFSSVSLEEASINSIIHHSEISRGSFYQYFEDKEDLYFYCLYLLKEGLKEEVEQCFVQENGNLVVGLEKAFFVLYEHYMKGENTAFYHQFFVDMSYRKSNHMIDKDAAHEDQNHHSIVLENLAKLINQENLVFETQEELIQFLQYIFQMMHWTISKVCLQNLTEENAYGIVKQRLSWMANGIIKKEQK